MLILVAITLVFPFFLRNMSLPIPSRDIIGYYGSYLGMMIAVIYLLATGATRPRLAALFLIGGTAPSLLVADVNSSQLYRWMGWVLMLASAGPLFQGAKALQFRAGAWMVCMRLIIACTILAIASLVTGVNFGGRGGFSGVMSHSMIMAPIAAIGGLHFLERFLLRPTLAGAGLSGSTIVLLLACGSRGALLGFAFGAIWLLMGLKGRSRAAILACFLLLGGVFVLIGPGYANIHDNSLTQHLINKGLQDTRSWLWEARLREFNDHPVFGVGFGRQLLGRGEGDFVEPGSSYLAILSMTGAVGVLGWFPLLASLLYLMRRCRRLMPAQEWIAMLAPGVFFFVHLM
ncbi:MAG: hypothetical protein D6763_08425, partial [Alphaproteobacteria bacterium]